MSSPILTGCPLPIFGVSACSVPIPEGGTPVIVTGCGEQEFSNLTCPPLPPIYYSVYMEESCPLGDQGGPFISPAGKFTSLISQADADGQATFYLNGLINSQCFNPLAALSGLFWKLPCTAPIIGGFCHTSGSAQTSAIVIGSYGVTYNASIRIRGVAETAHYLGGVTTGYWNVGGTPNGPTGANVYSLVISDPYQLYYLNATAGGTGLVILDYTETIQVKTDATVQLIAVDPDNTEFANGTSVATDNDPTRPIKVLQPYLGQFIQLDTLSLIPV